MDEQTTQPRLTVARPGRQVTSRRRLAMATALFIPAVLAVAAVLIFVAVLLSQSVSNAINTYLNAPDILAATPPDWMIVIDLFARFLIPLVLLVALAVALSAGYWYATRRLHRAMPPRVWLEATGVVLLGMTAGLVAAGISNFQLVEQQAASGGSTALNIVDIGVGSPAMRGIAPGRLVVLRVFQAYPLLLLGLALAAALIAGAGVLLARLAARWRLVRIVTPANSAVWRDAGIAVGAVVLAGGLGGYGTPLLLQAFSTVAWLQDLPGVGSAALLVLFLLLPGAPLAAAAAVGLSRGLGHVVAAGSPQAAPAAPRPDPFAADESVSFTITPLQD